MNVWTCMQCMFGLSMDCIYKQRPTMNTEQSSFNQALNESESRNNYPTDNPVPQTVQNRLTASGQDTENISETSSEKNS